METQKGITRVKGGWLARHYWGKPEPIPEYFMDKEYDGDDDSSKAAAGNWLKRMAEEYPAPLEKGRKPIIGYITADAGIRSASVYVAWTTFPDKVQHQKTFPYTDDLSKKEAEREALGFYKARVREYEEV